MLPVLTTGEERCCGARPLEKGSDLLSFRAIIESGDRYSPEARRSERSEMSSSVGRRSLLTVFTLSLLTSTTAVGAITAEQRREITQLSGALRKVTALFQRSEFKLSAEGFAELHGRFEKLAESGDEDVVKALADVHKKLIQAHALLELEGVELQPVKPLDEIASKPMPAGPGSSFVKDVAPILVARCGRCHVDNARGEFGMPNYASLMRGSSAGVVLFPGEPENSRIVQVIESGEMPQGGRVTRDELTTLKNWIAAGAKFDGDSPQASLRDFAVTLGDTTVARATGRESVSFARDIAPVLSEACFGCHVGAQRPRGRLNMSTFAGLMRGGDTRPPIASRQPAESLIIQRLKGEGGEPQMPQGKDPLPDDVIAMFEKWISEGATFDGPDPNMQVAQVAALSKAKNSTHDELSADRMEIARTNWNLGMAGTKGDEVETKNYFIMGNVGETALEDFGKRAETLAPVVARMLGAPSNEPLIKGRLTLFFFRQRYDYSEFGQMVEKKELPKEWRGHWNFTIVDAYGAMIPPRDASYSLDGLVAQQLAGTYVASLNNPPRWFSEGVARVAAAQVAPRDGRVAAWKEGVRPALAKMQKADDFLTNKLPPEDADIVAFEFVSGLMKNKNFRELLDGLREGNDFKQVFTAVYGVDPKKAAELWAPTAGRSRR